MHLPSFFVLFLHPPSLSRPPFLSSCPFQKWGGSCVFSLTASSPVSPQGRLSWCACFEETQNSLALHVSPPVLSRMGWLVRFLSHSVVSGFTSGAALLVCVSVAKDILGFSMPGA
ncbi:unnamed protein product [Closterium sp. NIES-54]